jgi:diguanylate cyclase (GGDEF)-like protein
MIAETCPDVVLLDLMMPEVGGLDILRAMREDDELRRIPVVILTSSTDADTKLQALELGANDFLAKPVDPSELALRLQNTLAAKAYQDRLTYYDGLTGLPNKRLFSERLGRTLERCRGVSDRCAVIHLALDRLRQINDTLGHTVGDTLLNAVADRLEKCAHPESHEARPVERDERQLARISGGEFMLLVEGADAVENASRTARRILSEMAEPFCIDGEELFTSCSVGVSLFPDDGSDVETLLTNAGIAMSHAKRSGGNDFEFYNESLNARSVERLNLENHLRRAVDREELMLYYQPKVDLQTGEIVGAEALARWQDPELGFVSPGRFIPIAEEIGLIERLGEWALRAACQQGRAWQEAGMRPIPISVNVSGRQFRTGDLLQTVRNALAQSELSGEWLTLELTEGVIMDNPQRTSEILHAIRRLGPTISVDDFGTGYSSLSYLKRFPLDELKIDRSFVQGVPYDPDDAALVTAMIFVARSLGLKVVAEGVETEEQLAFLTERGCEQYQGFLCSKPVPADEWPALLEAHQRKP